MLRRLGICRNAYYNYRKHRKADYYAKKDAAKALIGEIYHAHNGVAEYRTMTVYLARRGCHYSAVTVHKHEYGNEAVFSRPPEETGLPARKTA